MKHYNIKVNGRVQGVFYRATTQKMANLYSLKGFVKNDPDGSVYIEVEGNPSGLEKFISWCRRGPDSAYVEGLHLEEAEVKGFSSFRIKY